MRRNATIQIRPKKWATVAERAAALSMSSAWPHYLRLVAANGQVLAASEVYANRRNARRAVKAWHEAFFQVLGGDDPNCRPVPFFEFDADGNEVAR